MRAAAHSSITVVRVAAPAAAPHAALLHKSGCGNCCPTCRPAAHLHVPQVVPRLVNSLEGLVAGATTRAPCLALIQLVNLLEDLLREAAAGYGTAAGCCAQNARLRGEWGRCSELGCAGE